MYHQYGVLYLHSALESFGGVPVQDFPASNGTVFLFIDLSSPADSFVGFFFAFSIHAAAAGVVADDGGCGAEDYLILQLRLRKGLDLAAYKARFGKEFSTSQLAFVKNCVKNGYASFDGRTLALTPAGLIVQNSILAELL